MTDRPLDRDQAADLTVAGIRFVAAMVRRDNPTMAALAAQYGDHLLPSVAELAAQFAAAHFVDNVAERLDELALTVDVNSAGPAVDGTAG